MLGILRIMMTFLSHSMRHGSKFQFLRKTKYSAYYSSSSSKSCCNEHVYLKPHLQMFVVILESKNPFIIIQILN